MSTYLTALASAQEDFSSPDCPFITLSFAQSLDGSISLRRGRKSAISGPEALEMTHQIRAVHAGILVGIGTLIADDPRLTVRGAVGVEDQPQPVILDSDLRTPGEAVVFDHPKAPWIMSTGHSAAKPPPGPARSFGVPAGVDGHLDLSVILKTLKDEGLDTLMVEGGGKIIQSFLALQLVDFVVLTLAPTFLGGYRAINGPVDETGSLPRLLDVSSQHCGEDLVLWGRMARA